MPPASHWLGSARSGSLHPYQCSKRRKCLPFVSCSAPPSRCGPGDVFVLEQPRFTRRDLALSATTALAFQLLRPLGAGAAGFPANLLGSFMGNQPEPVLFPRKALNQVFAVLLMRSAYDAVDSLDFIPMDRFQAQFWKLRQSEYEPYLIQRLPLKVRQGDLTDPSYFDFITFAQLATISQEIPIGQQAFEEFCEECEGQKQTIQRSPSLQSNAALPAAFERVTGDLIYDGLCNGFRGRIQGVKSIQGVNALQGVSFGAPRPAEPRTPIQELAGNAQRILDIFTANGYAIKATVSEVVPSRSCGSVEWHGACPSAGTFRVRLEGPATLWGTAALENRRAIASAYDAMAIEAYLRQSGCTASYSVRHTDTAVEEYWTVA